MEKNAADSEEAEASKGQEKRFQVLEGQTGGKEADETGVVHNHEGEEKKPDRLDRLSHRLSASASGPMTETVLEKMTGKLSEGLSQAEDMGQTEEHMHKPEASFEPDWQEKDREEEKALEEDRREKSKENQAEADGGETALEMVENGSLTASPEKMQQFQTIMTDVLAEALRRNQDILSKEVGGTVSEKLVKEMNYLMRDREEREEERYRKLDETIRACQRVQRQRSEAAATRVPVRGMKKSRFPWGRRKDS